MTNLYMLQQLKTNENQFYIQLIYNSTLYIKFCWYQQKKYKK